MLTCRWQCAYQYGMFCTNLVCYSHGGWLVGWLGPKKKVEWMYFFAILGPPCARLHYWETTCLKDKVGDRDIVQRLWQLYSCSFLRTWPLMTSRDLEDSRWSWMCMVEMEQPLRQFSASSSHHDVMTATSEDASFPWFLVLSR